MKFSDVEEAFHFVSAHGQFEASAYVSRKTGETFCVSDNLEEEELPEDLFESDDYAEIPHKNDLDLGRVLVYRFIDGTVPDHSGEVREIFSRRGAYGRYKSFLDRKGLLDGWHRFEEQETQRALREWCGDVGISLDDEGSF
ncbi:MAG: hypothetical protein K8R59_04500 [Thermoanaerobaculales bacterium]|nr:hypothetical protein [Thermoanaerobaculales bacterium]